MKRFAIYAVKYNHTEKFPFTFGSVISGSDKATRFSRNEKYSEAVLSAMCYTMVENDLVIAKRTKRGYVAIAFITKVSCIDSDRYFYRHVSMPIYEEIVERDNLIALALEAKLAECEYAKESLSGVIKQRQDAIKQRQSSAA